MELTRLLRLAADAQAANDFALCKLATDEAAKCLIELGDAQSVLGAQEHHPPIGQQHQGETNTQAETDKADKD